MDHSKHLLTAPGHPARLTVYHCFLLVQFHHTQEFEEHFLSSLKLIEDIKFLSQLGKYTTALILFNSGITPYVLQ